MLTSRAVLTLMIGIFILASGYSLANLFFVVLGIFFIMSSIISMPQIAYVADPTQIEVTREIDKKSIFAGDFLLVTVKVRNKSIHSFDYIEIFDGYPEIFKLAVGSNSIKTRLRGHEEISFSYIVQCPLRGKYQLGPMKIIVYDKKGMNFEERIVHKYDYILVYPQYEDVRKLKALSHKRQLGILYGVHKTKQRGMGTEFFAIRLYNPSDELRFIDWKSFARTGRLHTKEYEIEKNIRILIMLDNSGSMGAGATGETKLEYSIRAAVVLTSLALERNDLVGLLIFSDKVNTYLAPSSRRDFIYEVLDALAPIEASGGSDFIRVARYTISKLQRVSFIVILSDLEGDKEIIKKGIEILRANGHHVLVIAPFGPWFEVPPYDLSPADKAVVEAVSYELWEKRMEISKILAKMEVPVISVGPDDILPTVITQYLRAKKLGLGMT